MKYFLLFCFYLLLIATGTAQDYFPLKAGTRTTYIFAEGEESQMLDSTIRQVSTERFRMGKKKYYKVTVLEYNNSELSPVTKEVSYVRKAGRNKNYLYDETTKQEKLLFPYSSQQLKNRTAVEEEDFTTVRLSKEVLTIETPAATHTDCLEVVLEQGESYYYMYYAPRIGLVASKIREELVFYKK